MKMEDVQLGSKGPAHKNTPSPIINGLQSSAHLNPYYIIVPSRPKLYFM